MNKNDKQARVDAEPKMIKGNGYQISPYFIKIYKSNEKKNRLNNKNFSAYQKLNIRSNHFSEFAHKRIQS